MGVAGPHAVDLRRYTAPERVCFLPAGIGKQDALDRLAALTAAHPAVTDPAGFTKAIFDRERVSSTGIGGGIAVPHAKLPSVEDFVISVGVSRDGVPFAAQDDLPVQLLVMIAASDQQRKVYLQVLASVAGRLKQPDLRDGLIGASDPTAVLALLVGR